MGQRQALIVYGSDEHSELVKAITRSGFLPVIRVNVFNILQLIRQRDFSAIVIDSDNLKEDALELVLNVRDIDDNIPIIWIGDAISSYEKRILNEQRNVATTHLLSAQSLKEKVRKMQNYSN